MKQLQTGEFFWEDKQDHLFRCYYSDRYRIHPKQSGLALPRECILHLYFTRKYY
jgi:hypothetical protein